jgi:hypothetical protein
MDGNYRGSSINSSPERLTLNPGKERVETVTDPNTNEEDTLCLRPGAATITQDVLNEID